MGRQVEAPRWGALFVIVTLLAMLVQAAPTAAASGAPYTQPRWWSKYEVVAAPGVVLTGTQGQNGSISVGANVDVSNEPGPQSETSIAINPANGAQLVGGSNEIDRLPMRGYYSSDGGATWGGVDLPLPPPLTQSGQRFGSDPGVAWDTRGNVYYSYIVVFFNPNFGGVTGTEVAVARSSDGGRTWTASYFAFKSGNGHFNDKTMIAVDTNPTSPYRDSVYVGWDTVSGGSTTNALWVSHSTDGGLSFSAPVAASPTNGGSHGVIAADPFVGPDGTLFVAWNDYVANVIALSKSTDGGQSFGPAVTVAAKQAAFDVGIPAMSTRRALVYPACAADTGSGPARGNLYCSWMDTTASNGTDIFAARSMNGGATWSTPVRVNDDPVGVANDQFNQWLAVDPADGSVNLSWNDTRLDPTHLSTNIYFGRSTNGAASFAPNLRVTTDSTNETVAGAQLHDQYGDYEGLAAQNKIIHPIWTDRRQSVAALNEEVFTAAITAR